MFSSIEKNEIGYDIPQAHVMLDNVLFYIYITDIKYEPEVNMVVGKVKIVNDDGEVVVDSEEYSPTVIAIIRGKRFVITFDGDDLTTKKKEYTESYRFDITINDSVLYFYPLRWKKWQAYLKSKQ